MDWYREGTRQRSRILYVFRTPGGVRVGRAPLEPEVLRHIQTHHPEIVFDWKAVLETRQVIDAAPEPRRPQARRRLEEDVAPAPGRPFRPRAHRLRDPQHAARPPIPAVIDGSTPDERVAFLAHWYPIARERVPQRMSDPVRREALTALAERLNPAAWTDADQVQQGLQQRVRGAGAPLASVSRSRLPQADAEPRKATTDTRTSRSRSSPAPSERLGSMDWLAPVVLKIVELGPWAPVLFVLIYIVAAVTLAPAFFLTVAGGAMFGVWRGVSSSSSEHRSARLPCTPSHRHSPVFAGCAGHARRRVAAVQERGGRGRRPDHVPPAALAAGSLQHPQLCAGAEWRALRRLRRSRFSA